MPTKGDQIIGLELKGSGKSATLPLDKFASVITDYQFVLEDGRDIKVSQTAFGLVITVNDLDGDLLAELRVPEQPQAKTARAARLKAVAETTAEKLLAVLKEGAEEVDAIKNDLPDVIEMGAGSKLQN